MSNGIGFIGGVSIGSLIVDISGPTISFSPGNSADVSLPGTAKIRFNLSTQRLEQSISTGAWEALASSSTAGSALAKYIIQQPDASLPNAQSLSVLGTGIVKNTTATGVLSVAIANTDYPAVSARYVVSTGTAAPPNAQNLGLLTSGLLKQTVSGGIATISIAASGIDYDLPDTFPNPDEFWCACVDYDGLTLSGNDSTGAFGIGKPGTVTRTVAVTVSDSLVGSTKTWHFNNAAFDIPDVGGQIIVTGATNSGTYEITSRPTTTTVVTSTSGTLTDESFSGSVTLTIVSGPRAIAAQALAAAKLTPFKTLTAVGKVLPRFGNNASLWVMARVRAGGATYKKDDLQTDSDFSWADGCSGWRVVHFRPTDSFTNDEEDKIKCGYMIYPGTNSAGYKLTAGSTGSNLLCQLAGGGAANLPAEDFPPFGIGTGVGGITKGRIRFLNTTPTVALRNIGSNVWFNSSNQIIPGKTFPANPLPATDSSGGDIFVIEQSAFRVFDGTHRLGTNWRTSIVGVSTTGTASVVAVGVYNHATFAAIYSGWEAQAGVHFGISALSAASIIDILEFYTDEISGYASSMGLSYTHQLGVGFCGRLDNAGVARLLVRCSTDISDTPRTWFGNYGPVKIGAGCVFKAGFTWIGSGNGTTPFSSGEAADTITLEETSFTSSFGNDGVSNYQKLRIPQPLLGGWGIAILGGSVRLRGIDISNCGTNTSLVPGNPICIGGVGTNVSIDDVSSMSGGNTGTTLVLAINAGQVEAYKSNIIIGTKVANTITSVLGDIQIADTSRLPFSTLATRYIEDTHGNVIIGPAGFVHAGFSVPGRAIAGSDVLTDLIATASGQFLRRAGNNILGFGNIINSDLPDSVTSVSGINLTAGAGLTGGGNLTANRTFDIVAADTTIVVNPDSIQVGVVTTANILNNAVDNTKIRDSVGTSVIGRSTNSVGDPADIVATVSGQFLRRDSLGVLGFGAIISSDLPPGLGDVSSSRNLIAGAGLTGGGTLAADRTFNIIATDATIQVNSDDIQVGVINTANINNDQVTDAKLRNSTATSVIGRSVNSSGDPADIVATASGQFLRRAGDNTLGFGTILLSDLPPGIAPSPGGDVFSTRNLIAGTGLTGGGTLAADRTFDIVAADGTITVNADNIQVGIIGTTNITTSAVTDAKLRNSGGLSVIGRSSGSTGPVADITATTSGQFLRVQSGALGFGNIVSSDLPVLGYESPITFTSPGNTRTGNVVTNDLITGIAGGLTITGGTASGNALNLRATSHATPGTVVISGGADSNAIPAFAINNGSNVSTSAVQVAFGYNGNPQFRQSIRTRHNLSTNIGNAIDFFTWTPTDTINVIGSVRAFSINGSSIEIPGLSAGGNIKATASTGGLVIGTIDTADITGHAVSNAKFRQSAGFSVVGVSGSSTADVADITGTANDFLRVRSGTLGFGSILASDISGLTSGSVPFVGSGLTEDNANFSFNSSIHKLSVGQGLFLGGTGNTREVLTVFGTSVNDYVRFALGGGPDLTAANRPTGYAFALWDSFTANVAASETLTQFFYKRINAPTLHGASGSIITDPLMATLFINGNIGLSGTFAGLYKPRALRVDGESTFQGGVSINTNIISDGIYLECIATGSRDRLLFDVGGITISSGSHSYVPWFTEATPVASGAAFGTLFTHEFVAQTFTSAGSNASFSGSAGGAATIYIQGAPSLSGNWNFSNMQPNGGATWPIWIDSGLLRYDGAISVTGGSTATLGGITGGPLSTLQSGWLPIVSGGALFWVPLFPGEISIIFE